MLQETVGFKKKIAVLASGGGSNLAALIEAVNRGDIQNAAIELIISNKKDAYALIRGKEANIPIFYLPRSMFKSNEDYDNQIIEKLNEYNIDLILLAGYLRIITKPFIKAFEKRILNIHPSLLPNFGGKGMYGMKVHQAVIDSKCSKSGCTVHLVTEEIDKGPILGQESVDIEFDDTPESLAAKVLVKEHLLYPRVVNEYVSKIDSKYIFKI